MHITLFLYRASQLHVHSSAILSDPLRYLRFIEEKVSVTEVVLNFLQLIIRYTVRGNCLHSDFLLAKLTRDLEKRSELFGTFNLSSLRWINSGGEAVVSKTAQAFSTTLKNFSNVPSWSFVISAGLV